MISKINGMKWILTDVQSRSETIYRSRSALNAAGKKVHKHIQTIVREKREKVNTFFTQKAVYLVYTRVG